ncbi:hypothetical protein B0F90DRAFT_1675089 [Multifurca ochricompacta]|uniref:ATP-dependent DNA helicase n=1 Tax=Multifurca ochricompacta TaxID=376703 RepID=A0AAD4MF18_9AGAM|nr:hypothetical protein B0F90DRAFT_1675089 [Multifurca ochricompacta]
MSSPNVYWDDEELDFAVLNELTAFEASQVPHNPNLAIRRSPSKTGLTVADSDDLYDLTFNIGLQDLQKLDAAIEKDYRLKAASTSKSPSASAFTRSLSGRQTTLFGDVISAGTPPSSRRGTQQRKSPTRPVNRKTKTWDHTAFAKTGRKRKAGNGNGRGKLDEEGGNEDAVEFEQFPAPYFPGPPPPMKLQPDLLAAKRWIFPLNRPKRDYQFNISRHCLFDNVLVALPTGLGKTFIAGVVMLNFYRWFPEGKVVFVAPTKPLVAQQIDACHKTCGIPGRDAIELTGNNPRAFRSKAWQEKRVFYMTPQTFENDLKTDNCDSRDIILLVVDEAHKGAGDYSYAKVVRFLMAKNPHFRVLALTATPGGTPEAVQAIVDALHISRIELRDEQSLDIRSYVNEKKVEQHIISMNEGIGKLRDLIAKVLEAYMKKCAGAGILRGNLDPVQFHPFRTNTAMDEIHRRSDGRQLQWAYPVLRKIGVLARAMGYLLEASPHMCFRSLTAEAEGTGSDKPSGLNKDPAFQALMNELRLQKSRGFAVHPKLEKLKVLVIHHFGQRLRDDFPLNADEQSHEDTRAMVFVTFREAVDEIVDFLNKESPLLRATKFIGQGIDRKGNKGLAQREQLDIINRFKDGTFNVLVATSVGEEGLDIGEVDLIVCYDAQKTPIRMLQRVGRTGRKREGFVHVLLAEGREEMNWNKAREAHSDVQRSIIRGEQLELYDDAERLLPDHIKPECLESMMDIEEYDRSATERSRESAVQGPKKKRKRNDDPARDIPPGACEGFVSVAELLVKQGVKRRKKIAKFDEGAGLDDETDEEIEAGLFAPKRAVSMSNISSRPLKTKLKRAKTTTHGSKKGGPAPSKQRKSHVGTIVGELTPSQFAREGAEDSDDLEVERGLRGTPILPSLKQSPASSSSLPRASSPEISLAQNRSIIDICTSAASSRSSSPSRKDRHPTNSPSSGEVPEARHASPSPLRPLSARPPDTAISLEAHIGSVSSSKAGSDQENDHRKGQYEPNKEDDNLAWLLADSDDAGEMSSSPAEPHIRVSSTQDSDAGEIEESEPGEESPIVKISFPLRTEPSTLSKFEMLPPAFPKPSLQLSVPSPTAPEPSLPVRAAGRAKKRSATAQVVNSSSPLHPPLSRGRLNRHKRDSPSPLSPPLITPKRRRRLKLRDTAAVARVNPWVDVEAGHSGDEVSSGESFSSSVEESESDRRFVTDLPATQASPSYDQLAVYRQSLLSQAPTGGKLSVPVFAAPPVRGGGQRAVGPNMGALDLPRHGRIERSSSPSPPGEEDEDYYMVGSFVVDDDAEISFMQSSEP